MRNHLELNPSSMMTKVLIIASDANAGFELSQMIEQTAGDFQVCGMLHKISEARHWLRDNNTPQLIFCDIELEDGLGFEIFRNLPVAAPVIFCTNCQEYALKAFENNGIDYLLKPLNPERLQKSLKKFARLKELFGEENASYSKRISHVASGMNSYKSSMLVYFQDKIIPVSLDKLDYIYYNNYTVNVHTQNAQYETKDTLNNIITTLNPRDFFRANRQFILHRKSVTSIQQYFGRKLLVGTSFPTPEPVIISKANATEFLKWVEGLNHEKELAANY
jgi:two-component system response regulator LytT